jgi:hypothetical protein
MEKKRLIHIFGLVFSILILILNTSVSADIIGTQYGQKIIKLNYSINNLNEFDEFIFIAYSVITGYQEFNSNQPLSFYKFDQPKVYAIRKGDFSTYESEFNESMWHDFFTQNPIIISSNDKLDAFVIVQQNDPLESAEIILKITYINEKQYRMVFDKDIVIYTYNDGTYENIPISSQYGLPKPSKTAIIPFWFESLWFVWLPIFSIIGIVTILSSRNRITKSQ